MGTHLALRHPGDVKIVQISPTFFECGGLNAARLSLLFSFLRSAQFHRLYLTEIFSLDGGRKDEQDVARAVIFKVQLLDARFRRIPVVLLGQLPELRTALCGDRGRNGVEPALPLNGHRRPRRLAEVHAVDADDDMSVLSDAPWPSGPNG